MNFPIENKKKIEWEKFYIPSLEVFMIHSEE